MMNLSMSARLQQWLREKMCSPGHKTCDRASSYDLKSRTLNMRLERRVFESVEATYFIFELRARRRHV